MRSHISSYVFMCLLAYLLNISSFCMYVPCMCASCMCVPCMCASCYPIDL